VNQGNKMLTDAAVLVAVIVAVLSVLGLLIWIVNAVLKGCLRILKRLERNWRAAAKRVQERLAEGAPTGLGQ
jgi:hypothetical protein